MRTRVINRVVLGTAAAALALGTFGAGAASAATGHPAQIKAQHTQAKKDHKGKKGHKAKKFVKYDNREYEFEFETEITKIINRQNQFGGGNVVGHFYHGGQYVIGLD